MFCGRSNVIEKATISFRRPPTLDKKKAVRMPVIRSIPGVRPTAVVRTAALALAVAALAGCALAPGMYVGRGATDRAEASNPFSITTARRGAEGAVQGATASDAPAGALMPITPELVKRQRESAPADIPAEVRALFGTPTDYRIAAGDVVNIHVWNHPDLAIPAAGGLGTDQQSLSGVGNGYPVSPRGLIQFPFAGLVKIAGLTEIEARELLVKRLSKYLKDPDVTVRIQSYRSGRIYVDGEVRTPGLLALNDIPPTLPDVIARAGGFGPLADRSQILLTRNGKTIPISLPALTERGINPSQILVAHGDLLRVVAREESKVFVLGEVSRLGTQTLRNGRLTLNEALGEAGGINPGSADPRQVFVVRAASADNPEIYHLDMRAPAAFALAEAFQLKARDVVYVDPVPLVRWNRVISLILPSAQAVTVTRTSVDAVVGK